MKGRQRPHPEGAAQGVRGNSHGIDSPVTISLAHPQFCVKHSARRGERFLRTPRQWFPSRSGGLQPGFCGNPSIPPSPAETHPMPPGKSFPAGIPHPSLAPPAGQSSRGKKLGVGKINFRLPSLFLSVIFLWTRRSNLFKIFGPLGARRVISSSSKGGTYEDTAVEAIRAKDQER